MAVRTARSGRHELRDIGAPAMLPLLCAAAFGPALLTVDALRVLRANGRLG